MCACNIRWALFVRASQFQLIKEFLRFDDDKKGIKRNGPADFHNNFSVIITNIITLAN